MNYRIYFKKKFYDFKEGYINYVNLHKVLEIHIVANFVLIVFPTCSFEFKLKDIKSILRLKG